MIHDRAPGFCQPQNKKSWGCCNFGICHFSVGFLIMRIKSQIPIRFDNFSKVVKSDWIKSMAKRYYTSADCIRAMANMKTKHKLKDKEVKEEKQEKNAATGEVPGDLAIRNERIDDYVLLLR